MIDQLDILTSVKSTSINFLCDTAACAIGFTSEKKDTIFFLWFRFGDSDYIERGREVGEVIRI